MTIESDLVTVIGGLCSGRIYPDVAPIDTARPYVTYQQVGGETVDPINGDVPDLKSAPNKQAARHLCLAAFSVPARAITTGPPCGLFLFEGPSSWLTQPP